MLSKKPFFKIPIKKLLTKLPERYGKVEFNESQWAMVKGLEEYRFWVHLSARRTGKSFAASIIALAKLLEPNTYVTVVAPNYNLSSIIWDYVSEFIRELDLETPRFNQKDKIIGLINGSVFRLLSANHRDSLIGRGAHLLIIDEAAVIPDDEFFTRDLRPALSTYENSRALFISTPRGKANYLYQYHVRGTPEKHNEYPEWGTAIYPWRANPLLDESDIREAQLTMPRSLFLQEFECQFTTFEGQIYSITEECVKELSMTKNPRYTFIAGLDMGYRDPTAFVVIATDDENFYVVDSYTSKEATTGVHAEKIQELIDKWDIENIYIDSAAQQTRIDLAYEFDIHTQNSNKDLLQGISFVQNLLEREKFFIDEECYDVYNSMSAYRWNNKTEKQKPAHDDSSHYCDAVRYAIYTYSQNQPSLFVKED